MKIINYKWSLVNIIEKIKFKFIRRVIEMIILDRKVFFKFRCRENNVIGKKVKILKG